MSIVTLNQNKPSRLLYLGDAQTIRRFMPFFFFIHEDNSKCCSFRNLKKIVTKSDVLFAVNVILNFSNIQNFENPTFDTKRKKRKYIFNRFSENITGECTSLFH